MLELEVWLDSLKIKPDFVCLSEHWMKHNEGLCLRIGNYELKSIFSRRNMEHGGVCIYAKDNVQAEDETWVTQKSVEADIECACIVSVALKIVIVCVYRRGLGSFDVFMERLEQIIEYIVGKYREFRLVIAGDFNLNLLTRNNKNNSFIDLLTGCNFTQTIFSPTREFGGSSTLIDNIFVNFLDFETTVIKTSISDHYAQTISFRQPQVCKAKTTYTKKRVFSKNKLRCFRQELINVDWDPILQNNDVDSCYNIFIDRITCQMNLVFPVKKYNVKNKSNSWITQGIRISCRTKRNMYLKKRKGLISDEDYKNYDKILKKVIVEAKRTSNSNLILNSDNKTKTTWSLVRNITQTSKQSTVLENFSNKYGSPVETLNKLNEYFINSCPDPVGGSANLEIISRSLESVFFHPTNANEICKCIGKLKNKKSVGDDEIPICLLKECADILSVPLTHIINLMFLTGVFPKGLKHARIKAIHKKESKSEEKNYRPISVLSNINKVFERIVYNRLVTFFENHSILSDQQNGFRRKRSTIRAVYLALSRVLDSLNDNKVTLALLIDLSKAFDSVDHVTLLEKLERYGVRGVPRQLIGSYLNGRTQCVVETEKDGTILRSDTVSIKKGVPQGSILGPLFYILYTNELPSISCEYMVLYADDTTLIFAEENKELLLQKVVNAVDSLKEYFFSNDLYMNVTKTQTLLFSNKNNESLTITYEDNDLESKDDVLFLGVHVDKRLDWKCHVDFLANNISRYCYALRVITNHISEKAALLAYYAYVHSRIQYGIIFWGNSCDVDRILILQKRCIRTLYKMKQAESCRGVFTDKKILTVVSLYILESVMFVHENSELFEDCLRVHEHNTRSKGDLLNKKFKYSYLQKNVQFTIIKIYNGFPVGLRGLPKSKLKFIIRQYLIEKAFYSLQEFFSDKDRVKL